jgi:hypothetical protein
LRVLTLSGLWRERGSVRIEGEVDQPVVSLNNPKKTSSNSPFRQVELVELHWTSQRILFVLLLLVDFLLP